MKSKQSDFQFDVTLCLQGGGSACAWQAGALIPFIQNPHLKINAITGTSGGALNGALLKHVFARHGQGEAGKQRAMDRLKDAWLNHIAISDLTSNMVAIHKMMNPIGHEMMMLANRGLFTQRLEKTLETLLHNDSALRSKEGPELFVQTVDEMTGQGRLWTNGEMSRKLVLGSAALPGSFHSVDGQIDGACLGGANPPTPPSKFLNKNTLVLYFMTSAEPDFIVPKKQSELNADDLGEDNLILKQAYGEIALLRQQGYNVHVIAPSDSFSKAEKGQTGHSVIQRRINDGQAIGEDRHKDLVTSITTPKLVA